MSFLHESHKVPADGRFEVSMDPYSQARFIALIETTRDMQTRIPSFITNVLWGSLSKGKPLSESVLFSTDIDICAFYNAKQSAFDTSTPDKIKKLLQEGMKERLSKTGDIPTVNIKVYPIDKKGYFGILNRFFELIDEGPNDNLLLNHYYLEIASAFGFDLTGQLQSYREGFFQEVEEKIPPEKHNALWKNISEIMKVVERGEHGTTSQYVLSSTISKFYPTTFKDAKMMYGINT
jgi:hypothetical protein